jgi:hypothetical protein
MKFVQQQSTQRNVGLKVKQNPSTSLVLSHLVFVRSRLPHNIINLLGESKRIA